MRVEVSPLVPIASLTGVSTPLSATMSVDFGVGGGSGSGSGSLQPHNVANTTQRLESARLMLGTLVGMRRQVTSAIVLAMKLFWLIGVVLALVGCTTVTSGPSHPKSKFPKTQRCPPPRQTVVDLTHPMHPA